VIGAASDVRPPTVEGLLAAAREDTQLDDFGGMSFLEGLEVFLDSMARDAALTATGSDELIATVGARLRNRLQIEAWYRAHPEIEDQVVDRPLFITGLPRTGSSALANLLSIEPEFRCLRMWEQEPACPPPVLGAEADDPRRVAAARGMEELQARDPRQMVMHLYELDATTEDVWLLGLEAKAQTCTAPVFGFHAWWRDCDMRPAYGYQRRAIRLLQSRRPPNRWLFKAPHYAFHLDAVCDAYPDARFVVTHRDPGVALASWCSLVQSRYPTGSAERIDAAALGPYLAHHQEIGMQRAMAARERLGEHRFLDVHHDEFVAAPIDTVARVYDFVGLDLEPAVLGPMRTWVDSNRPHARGVHEYTAAQFGLDAERLRAQFAEYIDHYGIRREEHQS
jgi:hypothetical protein